MLVAIAIPIFTNQLEKSKEATDVANVRSAYAEIMTQYLEDDTAHSMEVAAQQGQAGWQTEPQSGITTQINGAESKVTFDAKTSGSKYTVAIAVDADGEVSVSVS